MFCFCFRHLADFLRKKVVSTADVRCFPRDGDGLLVESLYNKDRASMKHEGPH